MLTGPEKIVGRIVFLVSFFQQNSKCLTNHMLRSKAYPSNMLILFCCDSDIAFSLGLHTNLLTVLYFSIINVLCGAGGDASFAPQANLVLYLR